MSFTLKCEVSDNSGAITVYEHSVYVFNSNPLMKTNEPELLKSESIDTETIADQPEITTNYFNSFNPTTTIKFSFPKDEFVTVAIHNETGQVFEVFRTGYISRGYHELNWDASKYSSGVYLVQLKSVSGLFSKIIILAK